MIKPIVKIKFSRHAKRRAKLYKLAETTLQEIVQQAQLEDGQQEIIRHVPGLTYPLKIIVSREDQLVTIITAYPLKKGAET